MLKKYQPPLLLELKPSKRLEAILFVLHCCSMLAAFANALPVLIKLLLLAGIGLNFGILCKRNRAEQRKIKYTESSGFELSNGTDFLPIEILNSSVITPGALFLHFKTLNNKQQTILVLSDSLCEDSYRNLIVKLKTVKQNEQPL